MVKHAQTIRRQIADELFVWVFDDFVGLALKGLTTFKQQKSVYEKGPQSDTEFVFQ